MAVSKRLRYEILRRDNHTCRYCGGTAPTVPLRVDHVTPVALGGTDEPTNLVTSCEPCNSGKSSATVDSALVADVSDDALRWAAAMTQAAANLQELEKPKDEYRDAFLAEWNRWHLGKDDTKTVELPVDWKLSIERFRVAGIPVWMWADIVDIGMANQKVKPENTFKYCCGIAWNRVDELHSEAGRIVGAKPTPANLDVRASVFDAAYAIWHCGMTDNTEAPTAEQAAEFRSSLESLPGLELEAPERIIGAALHATYFAMCDIAEALRDMDRDAVWTAWHTAWPTAYVPSEDPNEPWGKVIGGPTDEQSEWVTAQINSLLDAGVYVRRLVRAASHAGTHKSARIYHGLSEKELEATRVSDWQSQASELWRVAYMASGMAEPTQREASKFFASLKRITNDADGFYLADVYEAASAAGSYQDPDVASCLTRHLSVFEAAALPLGGEN